MNSSSVNSNVRILGWAFIVWFGITLCAGVVALLCFAMFGLMGDATASGTMPNTAGADHVALTMFGTLGLIALFVCAVMSLPGILVGWGLLNMKPWARIGGIVLSILALPGFPLGTALGVFGLITLLDARTVQQFERP